jgi:hypothetical protein
VTGQVYDQQAGLPINRVHETIVAGEKIKASNLKSSHAFDLFIADAFCPSRWSDVFSGLSGFTALYPLPFTPIKYFDIFLRRLKCFIAMQGSFLRDQVLSINTFTSRVFCLSKLNQAEVK